MKRLILLTILNFPFLLLLGQESNLYNKEGKLYADTTLKISEQTLKFVEKFEIEILSNFYERLKYPEISSENGIEGLVIIKVILNRKDNSISTSLVNKSDPALYMEVSQKIVALKERLLGLTDDRETSFYLPILFQLEKYNYRESLIEKKIIIKKEIITEMETK